MEIYDEIKKQEKIIADTQKLYDQYYKAFKKDGINSVEQAALDVLLDTIKTAKATLAKKKTQYFPLFNGTDLEVDKSKVTVQKLQKETAKQRTIKIETDGKPKEVKHQYKGVNFDYEVNYKKVKHYNDNLTDGGHYNGSEWNINGMEIFYNQLTNRITNRWVYTFPTGESINAWNDSVDQSLSDINTVKSGVIGSISAVLPLAKGLAVPLALITSLADNKLLALVASEGGLNRGDSLVIESTYETFRSTSGSGNGYKIELTIKIENQKGNEVENLARDTVEKSLNIFGNSKFSKSEDKLLRIMENFKDSETNISVRDLSSAPLIIKLKRRD